MAMVTSRSRGSWMVRADMTAGTAQAKLESSGMKALPERPVRDSRLSSRKAARGR